MLLSPGWPAERVLAPGSLILARDFLHPTTVTRELLELRDWLIGHEVRVVGMEATDVYCPLQTLGSVDRERPRFGG